MTRHKLGVILMNLGSPAAPEPTAIRQFLREFLSDQRVVELPALLWQPLLRGVILPFRAKRLAGLYHEIWTADGSPLLAITREQVRLLQQVLQQEDVVSDGKMDVIVRCAMTYGGPSLSRVIGELDAQGVQRFLVLPLYPQYSATTTGAVYDQVAKIFLHQRAVPDITVVRQYCERDDYLDALSTSVREHWQANGRGKLLLFSFHGIPQRCVDLGDPYEQQCRQTAAGVAARLGLQDGEWRVSFQSRFGKAQWLQPYTDVVLAGLPAEGTDSVDVICPAFAADCLETLEEIEVQSRAVFLDAGGKQFSRVPCLNAHPSHIRVLANIVSRYMASL